MEHFNRLTTAYFENQIGRITDTFIKTAERHKAITDGRIIPEDDDLTIGTGRRMPMAVLFLDISEFSSNNLCTVPEQNSMLILFSIFFTEMIRIAEEHGAKIEKNTGDGLMAYFADNDAIYTDNACKRAIACSMHMMHVTENVINPILNRCGINGFRFRVGIDYGRVTVARVGAPKLFNSQVAIGTNANIASKILDVAEAGEIIIGESIIDKLPNDWKEYCKLHTDSGWVYRLTGLPYSLYKYTGRWITPQLLPSTSSTLNRPSPVL